MNDLENHLLDYHDDLGDDRGVPRHYCDICGQELYTSDSYYNIDGVKYCEDCIEARKFTIY